MQLPDLYDIFLQYPSTQTDTRKLKHGDIYFALKGPSFNGNTFAKQALDAKYISPCFNFLVSVCMEGYCK